MAVRGHGQQIDATLVGEANELVGRIAHRKLGGHRQSMRGEVRRNPCEVIAVILHFLRLAELQLIKVARRPPVGDVHEMQLGADLRRELAHVIEDGLVGGGMLDGDENAAVHRYASVCTSSHALSAAMITATVHASTRIDADATKGPIFALSDVNITSGKTANDN